MSHKHRPLNAARWAAARRAAFDRDGWRCRKCGKASRLEAHHAPPLEDRAPGADPYDVHQLLTLCRGCHIEWHRERNRNRATSPAWDVPGRDAWTERMHQLADEPPPDPERQPVARKRRRRRHGLAG